MENGEHQIKPTLILLDVYETLLDTSEMQRRVNHLLDSKRGYTIWFELFMQYCFVDNCTAQFNDFNSIANATMHMAGRSLGNAVDENEVQNILALLKHLPLHEGVEEGLSVLSDYGFRIAALTNSPEVTIRERMELTGLISYFEMVLSAEHVKKYKPCIEVYDWAAKQLGIEANDILLVSAHGWDIAGASNAGMQTAYLKQSNQMFYPLAPKPIYTIKNLADLASQMEVFSSSVKHID
jgi:2-haloacid dehalogenase